MNKDEVAKTLGLAFPVDNPNFVTHAELKMALDQAEARSKDLVTALEKQFTLVVQKSEHVQRNWILSGVIMTMVTGIAGYVSIVVKLDRLETSAPQLQTAISAQTVWMQQQELRDDAQDEALRDVNPGYKPAPFNRVGVGR